MQMYRYLSVIRTWLTIGPEEDAFVGFGVGPGEEPPEAVVSI